MRSQPESAAALFPGAIPPQRGQVSQQAYKRRYIPKTYTPQEVAAARRVIGHWNTCFAGAEGAYRANQGDACNIKAYVRMLRNCGRSEGLFQFGEEDVRRAISAYRDDPNNRRLGRWRRFADWCKPENIDFYVGRERVVQHRREQPRTARRGTDKLTAAAKRVIEHKGLVSLAVSAARDRTTLKAGLERVMARGGKADGYRRDVLALIEQRASLDDVASKMLSKRVRRVFDAYYHRPVGKDQHDPARLEGIELALLDMDKER